MLKRERTCGGDARDGAGPPMIPEWVEDCHGAPRVAMCAVQAAAASAGDGARGRGTGR